MAQHLHKLLGATTQTIDSSLQRLERASGHPGHDVRLTAEIIGKTQLTLKSLGLDPKDSNAKEVYAALMSLVEKHDSFVAKHMGVKETDDVEVILAAVGSFMQKVNVPKTVYAIKHSTIKKFFLEKPPHRTMKALGYRSLNSMLKREPMPHVLAVALQKESKTWQRGYYKQYRMLSLSDFEQRPVDICMPRSRYWDELGVSISSKLQTNIISIRELGAILVLPLPHKKWRGICLVLVSLLLVHVQELRMYSSFCKLQQMKSNFGEILESALLDDRQLQADVFTESVHWNIVHTHFSQADTKDHPDFFEPHISVEDLAFRSAADVLYTLEPALAFWRGNEYAGGFFEDSVRPVSYNLLDAALSYANNISFENRIVHNMQSALWDEILLRYMGSSYIRSLVLEQLNIGEIRLDM